MYILLQKYQVDKRKVVARPQVTQGKIEHYL